MRIHALSTGTVQVTEAFLHGRRGLRRRLDLFLPSPFSPPLPIHVWAIEHDGRLIVVDTGETAGVHDIPFARFQVTTDDELPGTLRAAGLQIADADMVVLTHMHGDHMDGAVHAPGPVLVHARELAFTRTLEARLAARALRQPLPTGVRFEPIALDGGPFGAFTSSRRLSPDGRIVAVDTPGHTPGHISIICIDDDGRHVMIAGDATDSLEQLRELRPDRIAPNQAVHEITMSTILAHARAHPTVYLPSHDPASATRLAAGTTL